MKQPYETGRLEVSGRWNNEKMSRKTGNVQSHVTFFRHSDVLSLPAVLLRKVSNKRMCAAPTPISKQS